MPYHRPCKLTFKRKSDMSTHGSFFPNGSPNATGSSFVTEDKVTNSNKTPMEFKVTALNTIFNISKLSSFKGFEQHELKLGRLTLNETVLGFKPLMIFTSSIPLSLDVEKNILSKSANLKGVVCNCYEYVVPGGRGEARDEKVFVISVKEDSLFLQSLLMEFTKGMQATLPGQISKKQDADGAKAFPPALKLVPA